MFFPLRGDKHSELVGGIYMERKRLDLAHKILTNNLVILSGGILLALAVILIAS